ncbi:uncharacterized protein [Physcomitrium patens]|uniref:Homeobox domain-containing protein n=1 Tax=Physcomitrium patens TaxID=3218 RepID=A0A2K1JL45_PHYPA|nr:uncharacterized protein LOC112290349 isoform X1 [Physcomitrium patens]PNR42247.1 hypothetical protein PHYPA_017076 [Physcomitrium patens]|eukprot:XP_024392288.1 uncharacterized protein LOC112290349 isoform X1 [Physcomitrella patens]
MSLAMMHEVGLPLREYSRRGGDPAAAVEMRLFATASDGALVGLSPARLVCTPALQSSREVENLHHTHKKREIPCCPCRCVTGIISRGLSRAPPVGSSSLMEVSRTQLTASAGASPEGRVVRRIAQISAETHDLLGTLDQLADSGTKLVEAAGVDLQSSVPEIHGTGDSAQPVAEVVKILKAGSYLSRRVSQVCQPGFVHGKTSLSLPPHQPPLTSYSAVHQAHAAWLKNQTTDVLHITAIRNSKAVSCLATMPMAQQTSSPSSHKHALPCTVDRNSKRVCVGLDDRRFKRAADERRPNRLGREASPNLNFRNTECGDIPIAIAANTHVQPAALIRNTGKPKPSMILNSKFLAPIRSLLRFHYFQGHPKKRRRTAAGQHGSTPASETREIPASRHTGQSAEVHDGHPEPLNHGLKPPQVPGSLVGTNLNAAAALDTQRVEETAFDIDEAEDLAESQSRKEKLEVLLRSVESNYEAYRANVLEMRNNFDQFGGREGSLLYTALGLQAMSRRFRICKDGITRQLRVATREMDLSSQLRQARCKVHPERQLLKPNHRGPDLHARLPDSATDILRRWLFEHFLKPYPQHRDKCWLAEQTSLSRSQVTNWFINARVRLWKPMVEELYEQIQREDEAEQAARESSANSRQSSQDGIYSSGSHHNVEHDFMLQAGTIRGTRSSALHPVIIRTS